MYRVATFKKYRERGDLVSISVISAAGFLRREDTQHTSLRQAVLAFLDQENPRQFSAAEYFPGAGSIKEIVVYYQT